MAFVIAQPAYASRQQDMIDDARRTLEMLKTRPNFSDFPKRLATAKGVLIFPQLIRGGFIVGGVVGIGVFLLRDEDSGEWSQPAFYKIVTGNVGFQVGASLSQVAFVVIDGDAVAKLLEGDVRLGIDLPVAAGTGWPSADSMSESNPGILSFAVSRGAFGSNALEGATIFAEDEWNEIYYGRRVRMREIVIEHKVRNTGADPLRRALASE